MDYLIQILKFHINEIATAADTGQHATKCLKSPIEGTTRKHEGLELTG